MEQPCSPTEREIKNEKDVKLEKPEISKTKKGSVVLTTASQSMVVSRNSSGEKSLSGTRKKKPTGYKQNNSANSTNRQQNILRVAISDDDCSTISLKSDDCSTTLMKTDECSTLSQESSKNAKLRDCNRRTTSRKPSLCVPLSETRQLSPTATARKKNYEVGAPCVGSGSNINENGDSLSIMSTSLNSSLTSFVSIKNNKPASLLTTGADSLSSSGKVGGEVRDSKSLSNSQDDGGDGRDVSQGSGIKRRSLSRNPVGKSTSERAKRNPRRSAHRYSSAYTKSADSSPVTPKRSYNLTRNRVSVSEEEIMQLLASNKNKYSTSESPLLFGDRGEVDTGRPSSASIGKQRRSRGRVRDDSKRSNSSGGDSLCTMQNNKKKDRSLDKKRHVRKKNKLPTKERQVIEERSKFADFDNSVQNKRESRGKKIAGESELRRSNSSGTLGKHTMKIRRLRNADDDWKSVSNQRKPPRRTRSENVDAFTDDTSLGNFLNQNVSVSRRKKSSGSRSVAGSVGSMPLPRMKARRQYQRGRKPAAEGKTHSCTTKSNSLADDDAIEEDFNTTDRIDVDNASGDDKSLDLDLDLATARGNFKQQHLNEKLQLHLTKTDELLYSVFPKHIADSLRNGQKIAPENHDMVTIFFSDIVGFTDISSKLDPLQISDMLDRLYNSFDALSDYHDVFKVETIGDAYMAVTNLTKRQPDHCKRITEFAIDAIRVANQTLVNESDQAMGFVNIRVGFHSGSVVSNVVGNRNPRYCLFGDTVNTASRMESNSEKNRIHCSENSALLLREQCPKIRIFPRGEIEVKGKGMMNTFWVHTEGSLSSKDSKDGKIRKFMKAVPKYRKKLT